MKVRVAVEWSFRTEPGQRKIAEPAAREEEKKRTRTVDDVVKASGENVAARAMCRGGAFSKDS